MTLYLVYQYIYNSREDQNESVIAVFDNEEDAKMYVDIKERYTEDNYNYFYIDIELNEKKALLANFKQ